MAKIQGVRAGLAAAPLPKYKPQAPPPPKDDYTCHACGGEMEPRKIGGRGRAMVSQWELDNSRCRWCLDFFGPDLFGNHGVTNASPSDARARIAALKREGWGMILRTDSFADGKLVLQVDAGDIFKIERAGIEEDDSPKACGRERSFEMFSTYIMVGPTRLKLWPHEIAAISFLKIMELKRLGQVEECYVAAEDDHGYFRPSPPMRREIFETFGKLCNAEPPEGDEDDESTAE